MSIKFCPSCQRNVNTEHSWSGGGLVIFFLIGCFTLFIPFLIYLAVRWGRRCPICKTPDGFLMAPYFAQPQGNMTQTGTGQLYQNGQPPQQGRFP